MRLINFHAGRRHAIQLALASMSVLLVGAILASTPRSEAKSAVALPAAGDRPHAGGVPRPDHVLVVIEENHSYPQIIGSSQAPYINGLVPQGALFTNSHAIEHPSEPNYLDLFSGSNQGVTDDSCPHTFSAANLGSELLGAGLSFTGYSEDLPSPGSTVCSSAGYVRKHNPWVNFSNVPAAYNLPFTSYPSDYTTLPTIGVVVPNIYNDMHTGTIQQGDTWLQQHINSYIQWANANNSLLILTWDEDDFGSSNWIATIFVGPMVVAGRYGEAINHYNVLRTMEDMYDLPYAGNSGSVAPITDVWTTSVTATPTVTPIPTDTPTPEAILVGHVTWQGRPEQPDPMQQFPITLTLKSGKIEVNYPIQTTDASGFFTVSISSLASGTYDWRVKGHKFLANSGQVILSGLKVEGHKLQVEKPQPSTFNLQPSTTNVEMGLMKSGNCNDDDGVNASDYVIVKRSFGKTIRDPGYDERADFNDDGAVNVSDYNLLKVNFGIEGAPPIAPLHR